MSKLSHTRIKLKDANEFVARLLSTIVTCQDCGCTLETGETFNHGKTWNTRVPVPAAT